MTVRKRTTVYTVEGSMSKGPVIIDEQQFLHESESLSVFHKYLNSVELQYGEYPLLLMLRDAVSR